MTTTIPEIKERLAKLKYLQGNFQYNPIHQDAAIDDISYLLGLVEEMGKAFEGYDEVWEEMASHADSTHREIYLAEAARIKKLLLKFSIPNSDEVEKV